MNKREYLLICLAEELAEVQQCIGKCLRFTTDNKFEEYKTTNFEELILEMNDVYAITELLEDHGLTIDVIDERIDGKKERTEKYMKISEQLKTLNGE